MGAAAEDGQSQLPAHATVAVAQPHDSPALLHTVLQLWP